MELGIKAWLIIIVLAVVYFAVIRTESAVRDSSEDIKDVGKGIGKIFSLIITIVAALGLLAPPLLHLEHAKKKEIVC